jgi:hypothetical protein
MKEPQALVAVRALRDFFNHSVLLRTQLYDNRFNGQWLLFHTALDTIEDGVIAVETFRLHSAEHIRLNPLLALSGFLQLIYVQLDAVKFLVDSFEAKKSGDKVFFGENILKIRYLRNNTIGHPVKNTGVKGKIAYTLLPVLLIEQSKFTYTLQYSDGQNTIEEREYQVICTQVDEFIHTKISMLLEQLQQEEQQYKAKFSNSKLASFNLSDYNLYQSRMSLRGANIGSDAISYAVMYDSINNDIETFIRLLNERISITSQQIFMENIHNTLQKLHHIMKRLSPATVPDIDNLEVQIYVDALIKSINELQSIALEWDEEYRQH